MVRVFTKQSHGSCKVRRYTISWNEGTKVDSSLRENPGKKVLYFTKCLKGFSWQSSKARAPQSRKKMDKEIASFLAMTAKARWYTIPWIKELLRHGSCLHETKPWFVQKPDDTTFLEMREQKLIRHCEKNPEENGFYFSKCLKGFSWQSSKACAPQWRKKTDKEIASFLAMTAKAVCFPSLFFNFPGWIISDLPKVPIYVLKITIITTPKSFLYWFGNCCTCFFCLFHYSVNLFPAVHEISNREFGGAFCLQWEVAVPC